jgi:hypothetical protein
MLSDVADRVFKELTEAGYDPKLHEPKQDGGPFEITLRGHAFDIDDFKTMVRIAEDFGVGLGLDDNGWVRLG